MNMDPDSIKIIENVAEGAWWLSLAGLSAISYPAALKACQFLGDVWSQRIESESELCEVVRYEADKLGLDFARLDVRHVRGNSDTGVKKKDDKYEMGFNLGRGISVSTVRHELYHLLKDVDKGVNLLSYLFIAEPKATLYGALGIKL
jgi:hypothetical protein